MASLATLLMSVVLWSAPASGPEPPGTWVMPVADPAVVLRGFDPPEEPWLAGHRGVDLSAQEGEQIRAAGSGRVHFAGEVAGTPVVSVDHGELRTTYLPVRAEVDEGQEVAAGEPLGTLAEEPRHCPERTCLHWGLLRGSDYLDPLALLGRAETRLLPPIRPEWSAQPAAPGTTLRGGGLGGRRW